MHLGSTPLRPTTAPVHGNFVSLRGERFYRIANYDRMDPFFMSIVSASNHWMFISSTGGVTAGRVDADHALFPYYAEDRIHDDAAHTGSRSVLRVRRDGERLLWEPLLHGCAPVYRVTRNLYKHAHGNALVFEEENHDLQLVFRVGWHLSGEFGFVRRSEVENRGDGPARVEVLDGVQNLLPSGVQEAFQVRFSVLGDAYKQNELHRPDGLATFALSSLPGDGTEPMEVLRATVCWSTVDPACTRLLSSRQLDRYRLGGSVTSESRVVGRRGAYFVEQTLELEAGAGLDWLTVADLDYGATDVARLRHTLARGGDTATTVLRDVARGTRHLESIVARADGLQTTGDVLGSAHHFANVLFNVMRGGVFESGYRIPVEELADFIQAFNREARARHGEFLEGLGREVELNDLLDAAEGQGDPVLVRLVSEYLPLSFSRRHGDPSRPWNRFSIRLRDRDGSRLLGYEGNWRDIFQNWEALCLSFPEYLEGIVGKFVNTTTADGYNPYRVTDAGYDWEVPEPDEPWANLGYWGDHQLIYLLKLLEWSRAHHPRRLRGLLRDRRFVYADVPYDLRPYEKLLEDPRHAIDYDTEREARIAERVEALGFDGRYLPDGAGGPCRANLTEKLLVPLLAKLGAFVPGAGFWMNTQRPEWNDANNALAGYGASMVTLCYARRYVDFCLELFGALESGSDPLAGAVDFNEEVAHWLEGTAEALARHRELLQADGLSDADRKRVLDDLGGLAGAYRARLYREGLGGEVRPVRVRVIRDLLETARDFLDHSIAGNRREDGLYHAYNVLALSENGIGIRRLYPMLEGQVAVLSSGALEPGEAVTVLRALRESDMYRADQHSYMLYPDRVLPGFLEKNVIPEDRVQASPLLTALLADGDDTLVERDVEGRVHFNPDIHNVGDVDAALERLREAGREAQVEAEGDRVREVFEDLFQHHSYTGRSGTFYGYEGLGSIYWHMVSKLLLAAQESALEAEEAGDPAFGELARRYYDIRQGIGFNKSPEVYGAFPTDPYSHTPGGGGARQPGMTGQVKEEVITRRGELGLQVRDGCISFHTVLLRGEEFLTESASFEWYDVDGERRTTTLESGALAYTCCQVPVVYRRGNAPGIRIHRGDGPVRTVDGLALDRETSAEIFRRTGRVRKLEVIVREVLAP